MDACKPWDLNIGATWKGSITFAVLKYKRLCNHSYFFPAYIIAYGSVSPGREFWPFLGNFLKKVNAHCAKTKRGSLVFSNVPENLGLCHHKNVTVNSIALVKLAHNNP